MDLFKYLSILLVIFFNIAWSWPGSVSSKNNHANKLYKEGELDEALSKWRSAEVEDPDNDKLHYNIGNGLHEQKKYEDAFNEYGKSLNSKDSELQQKAYYNIGNTHYRMGKLQDAIEDYKKCLAINPNDEDAKYNIEFIKKKLEDEIKKKEEKQKESQQKENKADEKQQEEGGQQKLEAPEEGKENQEAGDKAQENKEDAGQEEKKEESQSKKEEGKSGNEEAKEKPLGEENKDQMSKEDAIRLLDAMKDDEKDILKGLRNQPVEGQYRVDKDW